MRANVLLARLGLAGLLTAAVLWGCGPDPGEPQPARTGYNVLFVGDTSFGENYQQAAKASGGTDVLARKGYDWPLSRLKALLGSSDLIIANLETPLTRRPKSNLEGLKKYLHWSDPEEAAAALARHKISVVSLANNHTLDYGAEGLGDTLLALKKHGIASYGAGKGDLAAAGPYRHRFPVGGRRRELAVIGAFEYRSKYDETYRFYASGNRAGVHPLDMDRLSVQIERLKRKDPELFVVVTPHWGRNYGWRRERETLAARRMIDAGADLVIGHGAHHFQAIERYKGRWIVYNLGNFVFNSQGRYAENKSHAASLAAQLRLRTVAGKLCWSLRCYPLLSDNLRTGYRPRLLSSREFASARGVLVRRSPNPADWRSRAVAGRDGIGHYVELGGSSRTGR